jgi:hypothetical protein
MMEPKPGAPLRFDNPFLTTVQASDFVRLSYRTLEKMRQNGSGPPFRRHGRYIRYHIDDLEAWSKANTHTSTHAPSGA